MFFDDKKDTYVDSIEKSIAFAGQSHDFYTEVKAQYFRDIVASKLPGIEKPKILDIGCGHGLIHPFFTEFGFQVDGVEVATEVLPLAKKANPQVNYHPYDGHKLPFDDNQFDATLAICVMHHVPPAQWSQFVVEMKRVLRPNGIAVVFEHNPLNPMTRYVVANSELDVDAVLLSASNLKKIFKESQFSEVGSRNILFTPFSSSVFRSLDRALGWCPLGAQYFTLGRKENIHG